MVNAHRTPWTASEVRKAFEAAHVRVFGQPCPSPLSATLTAWSAFETDSWRACWDSNLCNMRGSWQGLSTTFKAGEIINGVEVFLPPSADNAFRAYPDGPAGLDAAAEDVIRFIGTASHPPRPNRYAGAWAAAQLGDLAAFCDGLAHPTLPGAAHVPGFYTANPRVYLAGVQRKYAEVIGLGPT